MTEELTFTDEEKKGAHPILLRMVREIYKLGNLLQLLKAAEVPDSFITRGSVPVGDLNAPTAPVQLAGNRPNRSTILISNTGSYSIVIVSGATVQLSQGFTVVSGGVIELEVREAVWAYAAVSTNPSTVDILETLYGTSAKRR